ncbi:MAG: class I SAM-dependent methyltransferase [Azospirillaceae bacterium]
MTASERPAADRPADAEDPTTWFGDDRVGAREHTDRVRDVFASVAGRYDLMNDLMSGGVHRLWKRRFIALTAPRPGERVIDLAGGTGDIAFGLMEATGRTAHVTICDLSEPMVRVGRDRAIDRGLVGGLDVVVGNAESLPFGDRSADLVTIAFGLRNVTRIDAALAEARRVLRPGGRFACLEFSRVAVPALAAAYDAYSRAVIPRLGAWIAGDRESYDYLIESIRRFPDQQSLIERMASAGLARPRHVNLSGGIAAIHLGWRV